MSAAKLEYEDTEAVLSPGGTTQKVTIAEVEVSPEGTRRPTTRSALYNQKLTPPGENKLEEKNRRRGVAKARKDALLHFDEAKKAAVNAERREKAAAKRELARSAKATTTVVPTAVMAAFTGRAAAAAPTAQALGVQRDWAILRQMAVPHAQPAVVLEALRLDRLIDDDEGVWTPMRVQDQHEFLRRAVRVCARLVSLGDPVGDMHALMALSG